MTTEEPGSEPEEQMCWCCGTVYPESRLIRLGSRPEAGVCLNCTIHLRRRARERLAEGRRPLARWKAQVSRQSREQIMEHHWHQRPIIGPILRWINRHLL
ncbi:hypothetical protein CVV68_18150 [Arthrobacter livingstonensis]|uniref:Uncharacterized protein n=1 Tax=Arthrobacter livingstonensis TaxID=670078 RepID=A0A2V5L2B0_9MICC|nr:hypothetical protein CVV68_18150 [Arthrobacter livingstonensis]